jgi:hypothetical protein
MSPSLWLLTTACLLSGADQLPPSVDAPPPPAKAAPTTVAPKPACTSCNNGSEQRITGLLERLHLTTCTGCKETSAAPAKPAECSEACAKPCDAAVSKSCPAPSADVAKAGDGRKPCTKPAQAVVGKPCATPCQAVTKKPCSAPGTCAKPLATPTVVRKPSATPCQTVAKAPCPPPTNPWDYGKPRTDPRATIVRSPYATTYVDAVKPHVESTPVLIQAAASNPPPSPSTPSESLISAAYRNRIGSAPDYSHVTGQLSYVHSDGGLWVIRYGSLDREDRYGGSVVLEPLMNMDHFKDGDLVTVIGEILNDGRRASHSLGAPLYRASSITLLDRLVRDPE